MGKTPSLNRDYASLPLRQNSGETLTGVKGRPPAESMAAQFRGDLPVENQRWVGHLGDGDAQSNQLSSLIPCVEFSLD